MIKSLSTKGQLVLPASYRKRWNLVPGSEIRMREEGDRLVLEPVQKPRAQFVTTADCQQPIIRIGAGRPITDADLIDPLDEDA